MDLEAFKATLSDAEPGQEWDRPLQALWWAAQGEWNRAHRLAQDQPGSEGAWVHAYLHRVEGDLGNASYWYRRAGRPMSQATLDEEWEAIAAELLG